MNAENNSYTKETASFAVWYDCVKSVLTKKMIWRKIPNKWNALKPLYSEGKTVGEAVTFFRSKYEKPKPAMTEKKERLNSPLQDWADLYTDGCGNCFSDADSGL